MKSRLQYKFEVGQKSTTHMHHDIKLYPHRLSYKVIQINKTEVGQKWKGTVTHDV